MKEKNCFKKNKKGYNPSYEKKKEINESKMKPYYMMSDAAKNIISNPDTFILARGAAPVIANNCCCKEEENQAAINTKNCSADYFEYKEISNSISNICTSLMATGTKVWIKHIPTIAYMKSKLLEINDTYSKSYVNPLHIPDQLLNGLTFKKMSEDFTVIHPNEVKNKSQDFIDAIFEEMVRNSYIQNNEKPVISLLLKVRLLMEDGLGYSKLAEFADKYYSCEFANNSTIKIVDIRNRMLNSLADTAFAIEAERIKPNISVAYIKVYIRAFIMEHASAYQELLNLAKPKRSTVISEEGKSN